jgi:hypothetical protein
MINTRLLWAIWVLLALSPFRLFPQQQPGLTLIAPGGAATATLVDTNGSVVHSWANLGGQTAYSSYLMPGGYLLRTVRATGTYFQGGGISGRIQKHSYIGELVWDFPYSTQQYCSHHDICPLPNGNVMLIAYERKTASEATAAGSSKNIEIWSEKIVEIKPTGLTTGEIVWEWHAWDHLVQNADPNKANYQTSVAAHPELLNINFMTQKDWLHMNGIDYNPTLDQIIISTHNLNEVYVIDHSTTTAEAASHSGGISGRGGDILYRWGNPAAYSAVGTKIFNVVHDGHFIPHGYVNAGRIVGFNNRGVSNQQSSVDMIEPPYNGYAYQLTAGSAYEPPTYTRRYACNGYTSNEGNAEQQPNGNTIYCIALSGNVYEIDTAGNTLWSYNTGGKTAQVHRYSECYVASPIAVQASATERVICKGESTQLNAALYGVPSATYRWTSDPAGFTSTVQQPTVTPTARTTFIVTATEPGGCSAASTVLIDVRSASPLTIQGASTPKAGSTETYRVTSVNGVTYDWSVVGGTITTGNGTSSISVVWASGPSGVVKVTTSSINTCDNGTTELPVTILSGEITVSPTRLVFGSEGGVQSLVILSTAPWTATHTSSWLAMSKAGDDGDAVVDMTAQPNTLSTLRLDTVVVVSGSITIRIPVEQSGQLPDNIRPVTFIVDMKGTTVNATGIHVAGDFQEEAGFPLGDWQPHTTEMTRMGASTQYRATVMIPMGQKWEYKFVNGDQFYESEFVPVESRIGYDFNDNRWFYLDDEGTDTFVVGPLYYGGNSGPGKQMIRVRVDMQNAGIVSEDGVYTVMYGTNYIPMYSFTRAIYDVQLYYNLDAYVTWRFSNGKNAAGTETVDGACRETQTDADTAFATVCFGECVDCSVSSVGELGTGNGELGTGNGEQGTGNGELGTVIIYSVMGARVNSDVELAVGVYVVVVVDEHGSIVKRYTYLKDR